MIRRIGLEFWRFPWKPKPYFVKLSDVTCMSSWGKGGYASVSLLSYIQLAVCCSPTLAVGARLTYLSLVLLLQHEL